MSLAACGDEDTSSDTDNATADDDSTTDSDESGNGDSSKDESDDEGNSKPIKLPDGGTKPGKSDAGGSKPGKDGGSNVEQQDKADAGPCTGISVGARCVKKEHVTIIDREPQTSDDGNMLYQFDKSYENIGALLKNKPKVAPSADLGEWYMYNGDYVRLGVAYDSFKNSGGSIADKDRLPQRDGRNKDLTWSLNAVKSTDGDDIAAPNCLVCHFAYFDDKLIRGLGRNKHWIASDASGFTLNVPVIAVNSILSLDAISQLDNGLGLLLHLFPEVGYSHLFDLFAGLAMKHDPNTLEYTGNLNGGDPNSHMQGWIEFPNWWTFKKRNSLYWNGSGQGNKANHLWYMNWFSLNSTEEAQEVINNFGHVEKYLEEKIPTPKFEDFGKGKIDKALAAKGEQVFLQSCAFCHGTYSENDEDETYPNALVDIAEVGTDPKLATNHWIYPVESWYSKSWYAKQNLGAHIVKTNGFVAPALDGVFITAPYLHNGSVPTLEQLLDPSKRLDVWTTNNNADDYDWEALGWKDKPLDLDIWTLDQNFGIYNTSEPGNSNKGHTYGAALSPEERRQVLEYLKTL
ncbi:MAG TPA: hypothetical protein VI299_04970 [Polyangiales bacterium]